MWQESLPGEVSRRGVPWKLTSTLLLPRSSIWWQLTKIYSYSLFAREARGWLLVCCMLMLLWQPPIHGQSSRKSITTPMTILCPRTCQPNRALCANSIIIPAAAMKAVMFLCYKAFSPVHTFLLPPLLSPLTLRSQHKYFPVIHSRDSSSCIEQTTRRSNPEAYQNNFYANQYGGRGLRSHPQHIE